MSGIFLRDDNFFGIACRLVAGLLSAITLASCTAYKTISVKSDPPGVRVSRGGAIVGTTPFEMEVGAGDTFFCTPSYWSFELEAAPQIPGQQSQRRLINPCVISDMATIYFDFPGPQPASTPGQGDISSPPGSERILSARLTELANHFALEIKAHHLSRVAVLPLVDVSRPAMTPLGNYLTERITNEVYKTGSTRVIERSQLDTVIKELSLTMSGKFDETSVKSIGRMLAVDAVIMGTYAEIGAHTLELNTRIVNVETAEVFGASTVQIPKVAVRQLVP